MILELDGTGNQKARNIYGINQIARIVNGQTAYYFFNGHGDTTKLIGTSGEVLNSYYYDAFGNNTEVSETIDNPYKYAGYQYDKETKTYYIMARMYDPETGRFLQEDTYRGDINDPLSLNLYTYCHNNPITYDDPTGHFLEGIGSLIGKAANFV
ncbi:MAG: RHS repeat-associated core domain-containing protein, partial [Clostridiaceae bacterium]